MASRQTQESGVSARRIPIETLEADRDTELRTVRNTPAPNTQIMRGMQGIGNMTQPENTRRAQNLQTPQAAQSARERNTQDVQTMRGTQYIRDPRRTSQMPQTQTVEDAENIGNAPRTQGARRAAAPHPAGSAGNAPVRRQTAYEQAQQPRKPVIHEGRSSVRSSEQSVKRSDLPEQEQEFDLEEILNSFR